MRKRNPDLGIFNAIFGHSKLKPPSEEEFLSIIGAELRIESASDLRSTRMAGLVVNPAESPYFDNLGSKLRPLLDASDRPTATRLHVRDDDFGTRWVVLEAADFHDLAGLIHAIAVAISDRELSDRLLAAAFGFEYQGRPAYWLFNYKSGRFYPFIPVAARQRDRASEMRLGEMMRSENIPMEKKPEDWRALWGIPF